MTEELRLHWALHEIDEQAVVREHALAQHPEQRRLVAARVAAAQQALTALDQRVADSAKRRRVLDGEIAAFDVQQKRFETQLQSVTDQKQFEAVRHEIEAVRAKRDVLETEALERLEAEEQETAKRPERETALTRAQGEAAAVTTRLDAESATLRTELAALEAQRADTVARLEPVARNRYERLRTGRAGRAVAGIVQQACGACHHALPPASLQEAKRRERLVACDGCGRLLLLAPDAPGAA